MTYDDRARFEVVDTLAGWSARYVSARGAYVFSTRPYPTRRRALIAIYSYTGEKVQPSNGYPPEWTAFTQGPKSLLEVRDVTEPIRYRPASRRPLPETGAL